MNIRESLKQEHSKKMTTAIVDYIGDDVERFNELLNIFLDKNEDLRIVQRSAWPLSYIGEKNPQLVLPYTEELFSLLDKDVHDAVKRNILRAFREVAIPEKYHDTVIDQCFKLILKYDEAIAIYAFATIILSRLCEKYPELANELCLIMEERMSLYSTGMKNVAGKVLKKFRIKSKKVEMTNKSNHD